MVAQLGPAEYVAAHLRRNDFQYKHAGYLATDKRHGREIPVTFGINENELNRRVEKINSIFNDVKGTKAQKALRYGLSNKDMSTIVIHLMIDSRVIALLIPD